MPRKVRQLKADLRWAGFIQRPAKGSHTRWYHPLLPAERVTISGNDGDDARRYQDEEVQDVLAKLAEILEEQP
jgi:predicted RNA binding protein YcfA (HicA-like mRNA interferase family)